MSKINPLLTIRKNFSLVGAISKGLLLIFFDAFYLNQGGIALITGLWVLLIRLPLAVKKKNPAIRVQHLQNVSIYILAVILVFTFNSLNNVLARKRAEILISAVYTFEAKQRRYPQSLEELVPIFIKKVPLAKYTLNQNQFYYQVPDSKASLFYVEFPPFGRPIYLFNTHQWDYLD